MPAIESIAIPALNDLARTAAKFLGAGTDTAIIGPPGCGITTLSGIVEELLADENVSCRRLDCHTTAEAAEPAAARLRKLAEAEYDTRPENRRVLVIDHAGDLPAEEVAELVSALRESAHVWRTRWWLGNLDCRAMQEQHGLALHGQPRAHLLFPELGRDDLLWLYCAIAERHECKWGEALLYFVLDWCGSDLVLVERLAERFFGDWSNDLYDDTVADCLEQWLETDPRVAAYRQRVHGLPVDCARHRQLLSCGGKLLRHGPEFPHETDGGLRKMFLGGLLSVNLLPGYYTARHLLARFVLAEALGTDKAADTFSLFPAPQTSGSRLCCRMWNWRCGACCWPYLRRIRLRPGACGWRRRKRTSTSSHRSCTRPCSLGLTRLEASPTGTNCGRKWSLLSEQQKDFRSYTTCGRGLRRWRVVRAARELPMSRLLLRLWIT